ncbi:MAG TPA: MgtC/SapB family protein [Pyrinomonadaceae bacterium]
MEIIWQELTFGLHDSRQVARVIIRLLAATLFGALVGIQRERSGKPAGYRTHMLVCIGTAVFVLAAASAGLAADAMSRVIQGVITGIGFLGAGSILKLSQERDVKGLTTAASVWITAAIGVTVGLGALGIALMCTLLALLVLALENWTHGKHAAKT